MKIKFVCEKGIAGPLSVGMQRVDVRYILGGVYEEFKKSPFSDNTTDNFSSLNLHVFYSKNDVIKGVELFPVAGAFFRGYNLFDFTLDDLLTNFARLGVKYDVGDVGVRIVDDGIRIYAPDIDDSCGASIDSIYVEL